MLANQNTVVLDPQTGELLERLRSQLRESRNEAVVRKALALLAQVVEVAGPERYFTLLTPQNRTIKIKLD
jgi:hypothetical protein